MQREAGESPGPRAVRYVAWAGLHGYPTAAVRYIGALVDAGVEVGWHPVVGDGGGSWRRARSRRAGLRAARLGDLDGVDRPALAATVGAPVVPCVEVLHTVPELWPGLRTGDVPVVGNTVWETDRLPRHWPRLLNEVTALIVPSVFNRDVFVACGVDVPVHVVPHIAGPTPRPVAAAERDEFLRRHDLPRGHRFVYTIEAWTARKSPWRSVAAFVRAFDGDDGVTMLVKSSRLGQPSAVDARPGSVRDQIERIRATVASPPPVRLLSGDVTEREIQTLHAVGDCYLSLTHGEGWGLAVFEAAATGNPVVTTGWGAPLEYLGDRWPFLVDHELVPVLDAAGAVSFSPDQRWASASVDHAVDLLRCVLSDPQAAAALCVDVGGDLRTRYGPAAVTPALLAALDTGAGW